MTRTFSIALVFMIVIDPGFEGPGWICDINEQLYKPYGELKKHKWVVDIRPPPGGT